MEYFILERPSLCLTTLLHGATTYVAQLFVDPRHYSRNFWTDLCDFIHKSPILNETENENNYVAAEFWLEKERN